MSFNIFDENFYLDSYPDVKAAVDAGTIQSGLEHFQQYGLAEGRVLVSPFYDEQSYLDTNPDLAAVVQAGTFKSGLDHFIQFGEAEGRYSLKFDEQLYLQKYPEVADAVEAGTFESGLEHFITSGKDEGLSGNLFYDEKLYLEKYPDVADAVEAGTFKSGLDHFIQFGAAEGRSGNTFNEDVYLELNSDVADAVNAGTWQSGIQHYMEDGQYEEERLALFSGSSGNDTIVGFGDGSAIAGVDITGAGEGSVTSENAGRGEIDILIGGPGTDLFILGNVSKFPGIPSNIPRSFYDGGGDADYAVIRNFEPGKDTIELAGYQSFFYKSQEVNGNLNISTINGDLIATVEGVTSLSILPGDSSSGTLQIG
jgi:hypothetical protein